MRTKIKVKNLIANPYRNIETYPIDREKIRQLRDSIRETTFWDNILARPAPENGKFEIAYGHHRLVALREELGEDAFVSIPVRDLSDEAMLQIMANENMEEWSPDWRTLVETIRATKKYLDGQPEVVKKLGFYKDKRHPFKGDVGANVIAGFLGKGWSQQRISDALGIMQDKEIWTTLRLQSVNEETGISTLYEIVRIQDREAKSRWIEATSKTNLSVLEMGEIRRFENDPDLPEHAKEIMRENILSGRLRGDKQIKERVEFIKINELHHAEKEEELVDFINRINATIVGLSNKIEALARQLKEHPETKPILPKDMAVKLEGSLTDFLFTFQEFFDAVIPAAKKKA